MAAHGVASVTVLKGNINVCCGGSRPLEMLGGKEARISGPSCFFPSQLFCSVGSSRADRLVMTRQCFETSAGGTPAKAQVDPGLMTNRYPKARATSPRELEDFQTRGWSEAACDEGALLKDVSSASGLESLRAREAFASNTGDISEMNMEKLLEASVREDGQSGEDYRRRAVQFDEVAEFFGQRLSL